MSPLRSIFPDSRLFGNPVKILGLGDTHAGRSDTSRLTIMTADMEHMVGRGRTDAVVQLGDHTTIASTSEFNEWLTLRSQLQSIFPGIPVEEVAGNHDLIGNNASGTPDLVTPSQWAGIVGRPNNEKDKVVDIRYTRLLLLSPAEDATTGQANVRRLTLDPATLTWAKARCDEWTGPVVAFFHAPLMNTVGPLDGSAFSSYDERWRTHWDTAYPLSTWLASVPNLVAWVSGHTHTRLGEVDAVKVMTYGTNKVCCISTGSPTFWNPSGGTYVDPVVTCMITVRNLASHPTLGIEKNVSVRYRNHGDSQWVSNPTYENIQFFSN